MKKNLVTAAATAGLMLTAFGASASAQENTYTVQQGDTLSKIAKLNNVSVNNLKAWNKLSSDSIYVNQKLALNYTVQSGDTLWAIAKAQGTTVSALKSTNGLTSDLIRIGQQIKVPVSNVNASQATVSSNNASNSTVSVSVPVSSNNNVPNTYVVQKGDTLSGIGARYHLTVPEIKSMNDLTSNKIIIGRILQLRSERAAANQASAASTAASQSQTVKQPAATQDTEKAAAQATASPAAPAASQTTVKSETPAASQATVQPEAPAASQVTVKSEAHAAPQVTVKPAAPAAPQATVKPAAPAASQAPAASSVQTVISEAKKYIGTPYQWGGTNASGFDCSGFVQYVFAKAGVSLPRTTSSQWGATTPVSSPSAGDLVFFTTYEPGPSHVGIYLGNNQFISATDSGVKISDMTSSYWAPLYLGARKAL